MRFKNPVRWSSIHERFPACHIEKCKAEFKENFEYCTKDGDWEEVGERPFERPHLEGILTMIDTIRSDLDAQNCLNYIYDEICVYLGIDLLSMTSIEEIDEDDMDVTYM
jgi:hypothetical protein